MDYRALLREHPDANRTDLTLLLAHPPAFHSLIKDLAMPFVEEKIDKIACLDAMGFVLGGAVAWFLDVGCVLLRKEGKAAWNAESTDYTDYSMTLKRMELTTGSLHNGDRVLLIDDWTETGAQLWAARQLIERLGGVLIGASFLNVEPRVYHDSRFADLPLYSVLKPTISDTLPEVDAP
jgi:adenine phosphoribosyltransferase